MESNQKIRDLFLAALELDGEDRVAFLDANCPDTSTREYVDRLLEHHKLAGPFLSGETEGGNDLPFERIGDFRLIREIGRGAMGVVFLAEEQKLRRNVALKVLMIRLALWENTLERFHHEARITAKLSHPSIVPIYHFGSEGDYYYIASEYIEGANLADELSNARGGGTCSWRDARGAARLLASIADALHHAHQHGVIHRDVKPSNILIDKKGRAYLTDFGLARDADEERLTQTGDLAGTYPYMSPEQAAASSVEIDHRTDIFSLGIVLYEMISGNRPFQGDSSQEVMHAISHVAPKSLRSMVSGLSRDMDIICEKALEKSPADRFDTAADLAADLRRFAEGAPIHTHPPSLVRKAIRAFRKSKLTLVSIAFAVVALAGGLWIGFAAQPSSEVEVRVTSTPTGAEVHLKKLIVNTGEYGDPTPIGTTPLSAQILPGYYRVVIEKDGLGFAELTRFITEDMKPPDAPLVVHANIRPTSSVTNGMVRIEAGAFVAGVGGVVKQYPRQRYFLNAFYIDAYEVTHREYNEFIKQTGYAAPRSWNPYDPAWDDLPVVDVGWVDARAYAEWKGKRLPTRLEWDRAARGTDGMDTLWPDLSTREEVATVSCFAQVPEGADERDWFSLFRKYGCAVASHPQDRSPEGLFDVVGNVAEWVDTPATQFINNRIVLDMTDRCARGYSWRSRASNIELGSIVIKPAHERISEADVGFRCAKSATPGLDHLKGERIGK